MIRIYTHIYIEEICLYIHSEVCLYLYTRRYRYLFICIYIEKPNIFIWFLIIHTHKKITKKNIYICTGVYKFQRMECYVYVVR